MKLHINRSRIRGPWGGGAHFINAMYELAPEMGAELVSSDTLQGSPDIVLIVGLDNDQHNVSAEQLVMYKTFMEGQKDIKLVMRVNECDARKGTKNVDYTLLKIAEHCEHTVFVSEWLQDHFNQKGWPCKKQSVIYNGVDREVFAPQQKLNDGKVHVVAHHWSDHAMKGQDVYEALDALVGKHPDKLAFTYIGRTRARLPNSTTIRPLSGKPLGEELGKHDVYVSGSVFDPAPNHVFEAIACDLPTYVDIDGGGAVEIAGEDHTFTDFSEIERLLLDRSFVKNTNALQLTSWNECVTRYVDVLKQVVGS